MAILNDYPAYRSGAALGAGALTSLLAMHGFAWWSAISESAPVIFSAALFMGSMGFAFTGFILLSFAGHAFILLFNGMVQRSNVRRR
jgi:hypothetical protein